MVPRGEDEHRRQARVRVERQTEHLRICRWAHREMNLVTYYRGRPLLAVPLAEYLGRRRVA